MARLSERDRRILLGDNFEALEQQLLEEAKGPMTPEQQRQRWTTQLESTKGRRIDAVAIVIAGLFMAWGNHKSGQPVEWSVWFGLTAAALGAIFYLWLVRKASRLQQSLGTDTVPEAPKTSVQDLVLRTVINDSAGTLAGLPASRHLGSTS